MLLIFSSHLFLVVTSFMTTYVIMYYVLEGKFCRSGRLGFGRVVSEPDEIQPLIRTMIYLSNLGGK